MPQDNYGHGKKSVWDLFKTGFKGSFGVGGEKPPQETAMEKHKREVRESNRRARGVDQNQK